MPWSEKVPLPLVAIAIAFSFAIGVLDGFKKGF